MILWECFVCGSDGECKHREPELMVWARRIDANETQKSCVRQLIDKSIAVSLPMAKPINSPSEAHLKRILGDHAMPGYYGLREPARVGAA